MHELGLAQGILDIVTESVPADRAAEIRSVRVRVGAFAGVVVDSLEFCFGAIVAGTPYAGAVLDVEPCPARELQVVYVELADGAAGASS